MIFQAFRHMKAPLARFAYLLAFLGVASYVFITLSGPRGIRALMEKQQQIHEMEKRNAETAKEIERMREHIKRLNDDSTRQELEIRERLKLVRPGEKVYITGEPQQK